MTWLYAQSKPGLWTVGHYTPDDEWVPEKDYPSVVEAAARAAFLNGQPVRMQCGHTANATRDDKPVCVICYGLRSGADRIDADPPSLEGRTMVCAQCRATWPSDPSAAFFQHRPDMEHDSFYSGCRGWD